MEKKDIKVGNKFIPVEVGGVIPMTEKEWNDFLKERKVERDYFYMVGDKKYVHYKDEDYIRVSDIEQEIDKAREEGYKAMFEGLDNIARDSSGDFYKGVAIIKLRNEIARLSKLKDNK